VGAKDANAQATKIHSNSASRGEFMQNDTIANLANLLLDLNQD
jgi:hypothetical protein